MTQQTVLVDRTAGVATITMRTPALTLESKVALRDAIADAAKDADVRAVVLAGGTKAFCVGQDLGEHSEGLGSGPEAAFATVRQHYSPIVLDLLTMPKPVIAAVNGVCVGAGLGFALACDYRVFAAGAKLGTAFTGIGLTFDSGLSFTLPRAVGHSRAAELILFGQTFTADQAIGWGIAGETVDAVDVLPHSVALAQKLAQGPTLAYAESKRLLREGSELEAALEAEAVAQTRLGGSGDHRGAVEAFLGKQKPAFGGR